MSASGGETAPGPDPRRAIVVGPGRVGLSLARGLHAAGIHETVQVVGLSSSPSPLPASRTGLSYRSVGDWSLPPGDGGVEIFFAVPDDALSRAAKTWASLVEDAGSPLAFAFHTSGSRPAEILEPLRTAGARIAAFHPLRAISAPDAGGLTGAWFGVSGDEAAVARARTLAGALDGRVLRVRPGSSSRYHAAAVMASNLLTGCVALACREMRAATDASEEEVLAAATDLAASALRALEEEGPAHGLTGPLARGDLETVAAHLEVLEEETVREAYAALTRALTEHVLELHGAELRGVVSLLEEWGDRGRAPTSAGRSEERGSEDGS